MTMLTSWKLDPYTVMRLNSGRRGDDVLKGDMWCAVAINRLQAPTLLPLRDSRPARTKTIYMSILKCKSHNFSRL